MSGGDDDRGQSGGIGDENAGLHHTLGERLPLTLPLILTLIQGLRHSLGDGQISALEREHFIVRL